VSPQPKTKGKPGNSSPASSRFLYPRPPLGDLTKVDAIQKQNPPTSVGGFAAVYFGASPSHRPWIPASGATPRRIDSTLTCPPLQSGQNRTFLLCGE